MRRFLLRSHTIDPAGKWGLDDLCGDGGRVDVACRFLSSCLFLSHGVRDDVEAYIVVGPDATTAGAGGDASGARGDATGVGGDASGAGDAGGPGASRGPGGDPPGDAPDARTIRVQGAHARSFNPDERSLASRIRRALEAATPDPWWQDVDDGLAVAALDMASLVADLARQPQPPKPVLLDPDGAPLETALLPERPLFFLSDHQPFTDEEYRYLDALGAARVSLGEKWYHGNHVVSVVQYALDRRGGST